VTGSTTASLSGSTNAEGLPTTVYFQYGLDPLYTGGGALVYTQSTPPETLSTGFGPQSVLASLSGLIPNALYHWRFVATSSAGTVFGPDHTFRTKSDPAPPPPGLAADVNVSVISGSVFIKSPGGKSIPLTEVRQIAIGSVIDARHGTMKLISAGATKHSTQTATITGGVFKLTQIRTGPNKGLVTLTLIYGAFPGAPSTAICTPHHGKAQDARLSNFILQTLHASARGRWRTSGRYGAATVRGTVWSITDKCNGTLFRAIVHSIQIQNFVRHISFLLTAGHSYLARAP
jgi:hypothetical protein